MKTVKLIGTEIKGEEKGNFSEGFADIAYLVRKGHDVCGDSAFIAVDENKAVLAVLDGVSGEPDAEQASSVAALAMLNYLKNIESPTQEEIQEAFVTGHSNIISGFTTAVVVVVQKNGKFIAGSVGDSAFYGIDKGRKIILEIPPARIVGEGSPVSSFIPMRNAVPSALGLPGDLNILIKQGKLENGEIVLLATDAVMDNMKVKIKDDAVIDSSGIEDLGDIIKGANDPVQVVGKVCGEVVKRMAKVTEKKDKDSILVTKPDDLAVVCLRFTGAGKKPKTTKS